MVIIDLSYVLEAA